MTTYSSALLTATLGVFLPVLHAQDGADAGAGLPLIDDVLVTQIKYEGLRNSKVMDYLDYLTNTIGPRLTGSSSFDRACEWARGEFEKMGLDASLEHWATWPMGWDRGQWHGRVVEPVKMDLQVACEAWTAATKGRVRARLMFAPLTEEEFDAVKDEIEGSYLMRVPRERVYRGLDDYIEEHPIAGWVSSSRGDRKYPNRIRVFGNGRRPPSRVDRIPTTPKIVVRKDQADQLLDLLEKGEEVVVEFDMRNRWRREPVKLHNVVAEIKGTEKPDEIVVVCGHLDSWHQATGATDNGTGTTSTMEAARILAAAGAKPKRTIRFCLWGGEEQGLLGSREHVKRRRANMKNVQIVYNHDTGTNWAQSLTVNAVNADAMRRVVAPVMSLQAPDKDWDDPVFELKTREAIRGGGGSDHASFLSARVPAFAWGLKGRVDYFGYTWHSQWDTFDVAVPEYQRHTSTVIALMALGAANLPEKLSAEGISARARNRALSAQDLLGNRFGAKFGGKNNLVLSDVQKTGRLGKLGFQDGDVIVALDGEELDNAGTLRLALRSVTKAVKFTVRRGEKTVTIDAAADLVKVNSSRRGRRSGRRDG